MKQSLIMSAVLGALCAEQDAAEQPKAASVATLAKKNAPLSGTVLVAYFDGSDAKKVQERVAAAEGTRIQYLFKFFENSATDDIKRAVKEYRDLKKEQHGEKSAEANSARTRGTEVQSLYGAWRFGQFKPDGLSYHAAVAAARDTVKRLGVRWDGARIPEKWERDISKEEDRDAQARKSARMEIERARHSGKELTEAEEQAIYDKAQEEVAKVDMVRMAGALYRKYGAEKCEMLIDAIEGVIAAAEQEAKDKAATAKEAKAA